jgi:hypothetical protein
MRSLRRVVLPLAVAAIFGFALAQAPQVPVEGAEDTRLPSGKSQRDEILKSEHEQNIKDAGRLAELADELKQALEKEDRFVLSLNTVKKTEEIEKLARKIRTRLRHE